MKKTKLTTAKEYKEKMLKSMSPAMRSMATGSMSKMPISDYVNADKIVKMKTEMAKKRMKNMKKK